jgi:DNA-binding PadR family transcriptional regulator
MQAADPLGLVEFAVIDAVNRGALRSRQTADRVPVLSHEPGGDALVHDALRRCERRGLLSSKRVRSGRRYEVTAAGRKRLRADRRFRTALIGVLLRS